MALKFAKNRENWLPRVKDVSRKYDGPSDVVVPLFGPPCRSVVPLIFYRVTFRY